MRCIVIGAGAWGLPAAAELARRGHDVVLVDRYGLASPLSSSSGQTRLWRLTHPDAVRVRLARRGVEAMERLAARSGTEVFLRRGLLWRDDVSLPAVTAAFDAEGVPYEVVEPDDVGRYFPGLRPDGRAAVWQPDAGPVLAEEALRAQAGLLTGAGAEVLVGPVASEVRTTAAGPQVVCADGRVLRGDAVVLAPGPGAGPLLRSVGVELPLRPRLEQVDHVGDPTDPGSTDHLACLFDGPRPGRDGQDEPAMYAMPTPGQGYKIGMDHAVRDLEPGDEDRTPDPALTDRVLARVRRDLTALEPSPLGAQVCSWTLSPDGRFVIDRLPGGVVLACGDSGEGFKFSALMGDVLADLAEGRAVDDDVATFSLARFAGGVEPAEHVLGR
ncbi:NAD(P)/FAD-dependent oxidoreductase [Georgenia subflava]|uniref:FAD-dependent oxidoreductase n=1 Tax=Georgenia subflava TaxID=1622177 RepID=A0A6N7EHX2_9MICO|nr:FAD-dependent oxidoreductase [Georgenia subflava]MPV37031.1 FAD-dependent oxidoreductase [Georgenia subflava]